MVYPFPLLESARIEYCIGNLSNGTSLSLPWSSLLRNSKETFSKSGATLKAFRMYFLASESGSNFTFALENRKSRNAFDIFPDPASLPLVNVSGTTRALLYPIYQATFIVQWWRATLIGNPNFDEANPIFQSVSRNSNPVHFPGSTSFRHGRTSFRRKKWLIGECGLLRGFFTRTELFSLP